MKIFVLDTSSKAASAAVWEDGHLLADCWQNTGRTHSVTSLPMAENLLADCSAPWRRWMPWQSQPDRASFTGLRIGMAMVKGYGLCPGQALYPPLHPGGGWPGISGD